MRAGDVHRRIWTHAEVEKNMMLAMLKRAQCSKPPAPPLTTSSKPLAHNILSPSLIRTTNGSNSAMITAHDTPASKNVPNVRNHKNIQASLHASSGKLRTDAAELFQRAYGLNGHKRIAHETLLRESMIKYAC